MRSALVASIVGVIALAVTTVAQCPPGGCPRPQRIRYVQPQVRYVQPAVPQYRIVYQPAPVIRYVQQPAPVPQPVPVLTIKQDAPPNIGCPCGDVCPCLNKMPQPVQQPVQQPVYQQPVVYTSYGSVGSTPVSYGSSGSMSSAHVYQSSQFVYSGPPYQPTTFSGGRYQRRSSGPTWTYSGSNLAAHLAQEHGVDPSGMSHAEMVAAHSDAHNGAVGSSGRGSMFASSRRGPIRRLFGRR